MSDTCDFYLLLRRHQRRPTPLRLEILDLLGRNRQTWQAREILETLRTRRRVNKVTVYRILEDFLNLGLVRKVPLNGDAAFFELACEHYPPHPHFQCYHCGQVQCLEPVNLDQVWGALKGPLGNRADRVEILVAGLCRNCRHLNP
jgi:Fur family ferric uptake transcriptional regulator